MGPGEISLGIINAQHGHFRYGNRREQQAVLVDEIKIVESNELTTVRAYEVGDYVCDVGCDALNFSITRLFYHRLPVFLYREARFF